VCGEIGISIKEYYNLNNRQVHNIIAGYNNKQNLLLQNEWLQTREITFAIIQPHLDQRHKNLTKQQFMPLWFENHKPIKMKPRLTREQIKEKFKTIA